MIESWPFPVVGVGASAGGIKALGGFFKGMPAEPGVAIVVVTHLNPERESLLHEIIARYTAMAVEIAADGTQVRPNRVYVLPANAVLGMTGGRLRIEHPIGRARHPIDVFLGALAQDQGERAVSVVLSGSDGDGTLGTKAVKERGGMTFAQAVDGFGPSHPDMPQSAISTGFVDFAVPVEEMGRKLAAAARSMRHDGAAGDEPAALSSEPMRLEICSILQAKVGHEFKGYKTKTFMRRVLRRLQVTGSETLEAYLERLRHDPAEVHALFRDLLINVTNFFRDAEAFAQLQEQVIPKLLQGSGDAVRVWIPGCATGEEVYSVAILLREEADKHANPPRIQIFATDIDERALSVARGGRYPEALLESVSRERRRRFFSASDGSFVIAKEVRDLCIFSAHSVIRDPPFLQLDLVSCRNLLIYFGADVQRQVIPIFHYSLRRGGYLFLGTSETVSQFADLFDPLDKRQRIFRSRATARAHASIPLVVGAGKDVANLGGGGGRLTPRVRSAIETGALLRQAVEGHVLDRFAPPHVVVNRDGDVVYYSSRTGKYLEAAAGTPTRQLVMLVRKGLRLEIRVALKEAAETGKTVHRGGLAVEGEDGKLYIVTITVDAVNRLDEEPLYLVLFGDEGPALSREDVIERAHQLREGSTAALERELIETRERLQALVEEYETTLEELKSSNEELVSVNEESQSTNEELEASKEELQSLNEELHTVNAELGGKVEALDRANADLQNLFESTQIATIFLDKNLIIRSFTPAVGRIIRVLPGDRGRPITDLSSWLLLPRLAEDVKTVFETGTAIDQTIDHEGGLGNFLVRLVPYYEADQQIEGVVVTFIDVTNIARAEAHQRILIAELNHRVKNMLTIAIAIAEQTHRSTPSADAFKSSFIGRLRAMARSYELLSRENWTDASIDELVHQELSPFGDERVSAAGPPIRLNPEQALSIGMILHELATNATKYGALSADRGRVSIEWKPRESESWIDICWREQDGPETTAPDRRGFGLKLVERETRYNLRGRADIEFLPGGLSARLSMPLAKGGRA